MDKIAGVLLEREIIDAEEFDRLMDENSQSTTNVELQKSQEDAKNAPDVPEMPDIRVDMLPKTGRDFLA